VLFEFSEALMFGIHACAAVGCELAAALVICAALVNTLAK